MARFACAAAAAILWLAGSGAAARDLPAGGLTRAEVVQWLQAHGYKADLHGDANGEQIVSSATQGISFEVYFYSCDAGRCRTIQYAAGWSGAPDADKLNAWNRDKRYLRGYVSSRGSLFGEYDLDLSPGGTWEQLDASLDRWNTMVEKFRIYFGR